MIDPFTIPQVQKSIFTLRPYNIYTATGYTHHESDDFVIDGDDGDELNLQDLFNAALVNRQWYQMVIPFLWENMMIVKRWNSPEEEQERYEISKGLALHGQWIKTLKTDNKQVLEDFAQYSNYHHAQESSTITDSTSQLQHLSYKTCYPEAYDIAIISQILVQNPRLQQFVCHFSGKLQMFSSPIFDALSHTLHPLSLTTLELQRVVVGTDALAEVLNHHAGSIKIFKLHGCSVPRLAFKKLMALNALETFSWIEDESRDYRLPETLLHIEDLIKAAKNLQDLTIKSWRVNVFKIVLDLLRSGSDGNGGIGGGGSSNFQYLTSLKRLAIESEHTRVNGVQGMELLELLPLGLESLSMEAAKLGKSENSALVLQLSSRFFSTLTCLVFKRCNQVLSSTLQTILTTCSQLIVLAVDSDSPMDLAMMTRNESTPWVCTNLQIFEMNFWSGWTYWPGSTQPPERSPGFTFDSLYAGSDGFVDLHELTVHEFGSVFRKVSQLTRLKKLRISVTDSFSSKSTTMQSRISGNRKEEFGTAVLGFWLMLKSCSKLRDVQALFNDVPEGSINRGALLDVVHDMWSDLFSICVGVSIA